MQWLEHNESMSTTKPLVVLAKMNQNWPTTRPQLGTGWVCGEEPKPPTFALDTKRFRAIDLSCHARDACGAGAGCWAWIPGWGATQSYNPNFRLARTCGTNEVVCAGKRHQRRTGYRDSQLGPKVNKQLFREHIVREVTSLTILTIVVEM